MIISEKLSRISSRVNFALGVATFAKADSRLGLLVGTVLILVGAIGGWRDE